jgi:hypothetical protein
MSKKKPICSHCKSDDVLVDAWAVWDEKGQKWELQTTFDKPAHCNECDGETSIEWIEVQVAK